MEDKSEELLKLTRENNEILRGMRKRARWHSVFIVLYWLVIGGVMVAAYHYVQPYLEALFETYSAVQDGIGKISNFGS